MEYIAIIGLIVAVVQLWRRTDHLERKIAELEPPPPSYFEPTRPLEPTEAEAAPPPPEPASAVPPLPDMVPQWEPAEPEPLYEDEPAEPRRLGLPRLTFDFEDIFGRRLPIWAGGIALALGGIFLVRFSIEAGLLTPAVRVLLSFAFGLLLLAAAEAAYRFEHRIADPRVRQALAGAGLATLYAGFYLAGSRYGLIAAGASFMGLAAVTAAAILLSFRFGLPSAVLGLVGGFAAPALVASEEANVPVLTLYLALVTAGLAFTGRRQQRPWLGFAALAASLVWGGLLLASDFAQTPDLVAFGIYLTTAGALLPLLAGGGERWHWPRFAAGLIASLQMAALIERAGFEPLTWGLYLLLAAALATVGWREPRMREANAFVAALGVWMLSLWGQPWSTGAELPPWTAFAPVVAGMAAVFLGTPLALTLLGRGRRLDLAQLSLAAPALAAVTYDHYGRFDTGGAEPGLALVTFGFAVPPALAALRAWRATDDEAWLALPLASAAALVFAALLMLAPGWTAPVAAMAVGWLLVRLAHLRRAVPLLNLAWAGALVGLVALVGTPEFLAESERLGGFASDADRGRAVARWLAAGLPMLGLAWIDGRSIARRAAEAAVALAAYGALAQVLSAQWLPWASALGAVAVSWRLADRTGGWATLLAVAALWALAPTGEWLQQGLLAFAGEAPMLVGSLPSWREALLDLAPLAAGTAFAAWRLREARPMAARGLAGLAAIVGSIAAHVLFKQGFALDSLAAFHRHGFAERTVWEALLTAGAVLLAWRTPARAVAAVLLALSLGHFAWFTLAVHNPLWEMQAVGAWPIINWLLPAYGVAAAGLMAGKRLAPDHARHTATIADAALMALIALYSLSELRHAFAGSLLVSVPVGQSEDLLRSLLGIVLAIGFLAWGARQRRRDWRIGSLVLMLLAVGKVFVVDAAGLEGLLRVASFLALGFSLIGIGWVYTRQLKAQPAGTAA